MKNPNLKSANVHMSSMLVDLMNAGCFVISARLDKYHIDRPEWFKFHIHVKDTPELAQWIGERGYKVSYNNTGTPNRVSIQFPDGEVFYLV